MASSNKHEDRLAILIHADNGNPARLPQLLAEIAKYGTASVRRAHGNWTSGHLGGWKSMLLQHCTQSMQQFNYTTGISMASASCPATAISPGWHRASARRG